MLRFHKKSRRDQITDSVKHAGETVVKTAKQASPAKTVPIALATVGAAFAAFKAVRGHGDAHPA